MAGIFNISILWFWAFWFVWVLVADFIDLGQIWGLLPADMAGSSGNFAYLTMVTRRWAPSWGFNMGLYLIIVFWALVGFIMHLRAASAPHNTVWALQSFIISLAMNGAFVLGDMVFVDLKASASHMDRLFFESLTFALFCALHFLSRLRQL